MSRCDVFANNYLAPFRDRWQSARPLPIPKIHRRETRNALRARNTPAKERIMRKTKSKSPAALFPIFRQGDVLIQRIDPSQLPKKTEEIPREAGRVVLAHGEVTGHAHAIRDPGVCFLRAEGTTDRFLQVVTTCLVEHEEHSTISLGGGATPENPALYRIRIQREWAGAISRAVVD